MDAISRLIPGVLGDPDGAQDDSHASGLLEYPHYTRPLEFRGWRVPDELVSGNHALIARWRREQSLLRTWKRRPDMLERTELSAADRKWLARLEREAALHVSAPAEDAAPDQEGRGFEQGNDQSGAGRNI